jgi:hypothetical protein
LRFSKLTGEFRIGQPLTEDVADQFAASLPVTAIRLASVVAKGLLVDVAEQMERFDAYIGPFKAAFQETPKVFNTVGVDIPVDVFDRVVDDRVPVVSIESTVKLI